MRFEDLTRAELLQVLEAELAKALSELKSSQNDIDKANARIRFILAAVHNLKDKQI